MFSFSGLKWFTVPVLADTWHYGSGKHGPEDWPGMCQTGTRQSPIDLDPEITVPGTFEPLVLLHYDRKANASITNNGHTVKLTLDQPCEIVMAAGGLPGVYQLDQIHFHWKSEHTFRGKRWSLEMHIVHHNIKYPSLTEAGKHRQGIAVLGVLFHETDDTNKALAPLIDAVAKVHTYGAVYSLPQRIEVDDMLPNEINSFYRYQGSLTTPNCDETVVWTVLTHLVPIGTAQIEQFLRVKGIHGELKSNYRPIQKLDNRRVFLQQPHDMDNEIASPSSRVTFSWCLVLLCGVSYYFS
ncbi:hypothetical protein L9F63_012051 [Diploptera punctata]|uniref:Alpha-carbonic anhydrase domain-containing protein n=1 Tax=Diploptera punctata TaxID=6984 RepID=A0AAD8AE51_DIPPU|nr:hypothetical protein L9F63_012051 [Diploptera punctata]